MDKIKIFLGSSLKARSQAKKVIEGLSSPDIEFLPWWDSFTPGRTLLEELDSISKKVDGALLLFSPESETMIRKKNHIIPNMNVLFEFGYFFGSFGKERVAILKFGDYYLPSDLEGNIHIFGSDSFKSGKGSNVSKRTIREFNRWTKEF